MKLTQPQPSFTDERGIIVDLLDNCHVTLIRSVVGSVRGNHVHNETTQWVYVLHGAMWYYWREPSGVVQGHLCTWGDMIETPPGEPHAYRMETNTKLLVLTQGPRKGADYDKDTYPVEALV
jgi:quercetin dioxygenase-like cupin family protein